MIEFRNEPLTDFSKTENRQAMQAALEKVKSQFGREYLLIVGGEQIYTPQKIKSINPGNLEQIVGYVSQADQTLADKAMAAAWHRFADRQFTDPCERAGYLFKAAAAMRRRKFEFANWMIYEVGKNWVEADADVAEAIDFLEYYGRESIRLHEAKQLVPYAGEDNRLTYIPLGVGIIIPPWNFPLAILVGTTVSAVVTGNTVLLKPASPSPIIAAKFVGLMEEIGLPPGVINLVPGSGQEIGDFLVEHPKTRFISFTGSKEVGLRINERAAKTAPGQIWIKRLVAEMGGKDAIVVDESADPMEAAIGIVQSAFGFQGQKCSAGSRAIVHKNLYETVLEKVTELTNSLQIGLPEENCPVGPVIDAQVYRKILGYIEIGKTEGRLVTGGGKANGPGYYIQPTIFADVKENARVMKEEIFGPVLAFCKADSFEHAVAIFNNTEYGLTGSLYSNSRPHLEYARKHMHCGNLYFNYLLLFTQAKVVSERL
ncbi:L-glutamate gamma-semialdehyde dehydrogenase [Effusibacillus dendaii]|uniref:L-glutamate gamma-semialdehyde dehydrogenase n=1 Tax=Effusibacillus dendaii TaxID=2743772 RepID=A0A7I8D921_9BACL|nr:L-glutamate gamma-semialdehyde dehydrogenase [Effusibacillus dendaii]BCJ86643.1 1-pyrroline-5-carboxylate dehydrogenase [Effusibacillus dendaii]